MPQPPLESDWRKFGAMIPKLRERYLAERNARVMALLTADKKCETERFWDAMDEMAREARVLQECLDDHSRSRMWLHLRSMIRAGMLTQEDLPEFSGELQKELSHVFAEKTAVPPPEPKSASVTPAAGQPPRQR